MLRGGKYVIRTITSGRVKEKSKVWIPANAIVRKGRVKGNTAAAKRDSNERSAIKQLARVINCNFSKKDIYLTLTYSDSDLPADMTAQQKDATNFIRRLERAAKKAGVEDPKRIIVCSEKDGKTRESVRPHIHIVFSGTGFEFRNGEWYIGKRKLLSIWGKGGVYAEPLRTQDDYTPLAAYLIRQAGADESGKKYRCSQNMAKPIITEELAVTDRQLRAPVGARVMEQRYNDLEGINYVRYVRPEKKDRKQPRE